MKNPPQSGSGQQGQETHSNQSQPGSGPGQGKAPPKGGHRYVTMPGRTSSSRHGDRYCSPGISLCPRCHLNIEVHVFSITGSMFGVCVTSVKHEGGVTTLSMLNDEEFIYHSDFCH